MSRALARSLVGPGLALVLAGCPSRGRTPCAPSEPARLEVRDATGALELAVKESATRGAPPVYDLCDGAHRRVGSLEVGERRAVVLDGAGKLVLRLEVPAGDDPAGWGPAGARLRVHRDRGEWRVLKPDGVPFGSISDGEGGGATVFDAASRAVASVKRRGADQVLAGEDGATTRYVVPAAAAVPAGVFALPGLAVEEQVALYFMFPR